MVHNAATEMGASRAMSRMRARGKTVFGRDAQFGSLSFEVAWQGKRRIMERQQGSVSTSRLSISV